MVLRNNTMEKIWYCVITMVRWKKQRYYIKNYGNIRFDKKKKTFAILAKMKLLFMMERK